MRNETKLFKPGQGIQDKGLDCVFPVGNIPQQFKRLVKTVGFFNEDGLGALTKFRKSHNSFLLWVNNESGFGEMSSKR